MNSFKTQVNAYRLANFGKFVKASLLDQWSWQFWQLFASGNYMQIISSDTVLTFWQIWWICQRFKYSVCKILLQLVNTFYLPYDY